MRTRRAIWGGGGAAGHVVLVAQGFDPFGVGSREGGVAAKPHRGAVVAGGAGQGGDGFQTVAADRLAVGDTDLSFGGAFLEAAGDDRTEQGADDGK